MNRAPKLLPSVLTCALLAALFLAATASAEVRVGETTAPVNPAVKPEADVIAAKAEYDTEAGKVTFKVTTAGVPWAGTEAEPSEFEMVGGLASLSPCRSAPFGVSPFPIFTLQYRYSEPEHALWSLQESSSSTPEPPETFGNGAVSTSATTTTLVAAAPRAVNRPFTCAVALVHTSSTSGESLFFPIAVPPPPPPPPPAPAPVPTPPAAPAAALSIAKLKPLKLKVDKWKTVRITVANTGGTATAPGSLRLKAPRGVLVKPEKQKLPVLKAGGSWTVSAKVELTAKAKKKVTISLTAVAGSASAKASLVLKRKG